MLGSQVFRIRRNPGQAAAVNLFNNLLAGIYRVDAAEPFALGARAEDDPRALYELVGAPSVLSWMLVDRVGRHHADEYKPRARTDVLANDIALTLELARNLGADGPLGELAREIFERALAAGWPTRTTP